MGYDLFFILEANKYKWGLQFITYSMNENCTKILNKKNHKEIKKGSR